MPAKGAAYEEAKRILKAECIRTNAQCWICRGDKGSMKYDGDYNDPLAFTADHVTPTSLGGNHTQLSGLRGCHRVCNSSRGNTTRGLYPTSRQW